MFEPKGLCSYLMVNVERSKFSKNVKTPTQLKALIYSILNRGRKTQELPEYLELELEQASELLSDTIRKICGLTQQEKVKEVKVDKVELRRQKNEESNKRFIRKSYKEKVIDISEKPKEIQNKSSIKKFVSLKATLSQLYIKGNPPIFNLSLKSEYTDQIIYVRILERHIKMKPSKLKNYKGSIKVTGQVFESDYHLNTYGVKNIIRSIDELDAIEILDDENLLDLTLVEPPF